MPYVAPVVAATFVWTTMLNPQFGIVNYYGTTPARLGRADRLPQLLRAGLDLRLRHPRHHRARERDPLRGVAVLPVRLPVPDRADPGDPRDVGGGGHGRRGDADAALPPHRPAAAAADHRRADRAAVHLDLQQLRRHLPAHRRRRRHPGRRGARLRLPDQPRRHRRRCRPGAGPGRDPRGARRPSTSSCSADRRRSHEHRTPASAATPSSAGILAVVRPVVHRLPARHLPVPLLLHGAAVVPAARRGAAGPRCALVPSLGEIDLDTYKDVLAVDRGRRAGLPELHQEQHVLVAIGTVVLSLLVADPRRVRRQPARVLRPAPDQRGVPRGLLLPGDPAGDPAVRVLHPDRASAAP